MDLLGKLAKASLYHTLFQALIIIVANHKCGVKITKDFKPFAIFKSQGGGIINKKEIVISYSVWQDDITCYDDFSDIPGGKESIITKETVHYLLDTFSWDKDADMKSEIESVIPSMVGITKEDLFNIVDRFCNNPYGNPLTVLFEHC